MRSSASATPRWKARDDALARANLDHDAIIEERWTTAVHERTAALYERDEALDERGEPIRARSASPSATRLRRARPRGRGATDAVRDLEALEQRWRQTDQARAEAISAHVPSAGAVRVAPGEDRERRQRTGWSGPSASSR